MLRLAILKIAALVSLALPFSACAQAVITTVAGSTWIFRGDGSPAKNLALGQPDGLTADAAGNVYATDRDDNLIVKISPSGILTVVAGNGLRGFSGDGGPATSASLYLPVETVLDGAGNLYIVDYGNQRIRRVSPDRKSTRLNSSHRL